MKYAKRKLIGDFLVTCELMRDKRILLSVDHKDKSYNPSSIIQFDIDLFSVDEVSMQTGEAHLESSFRDVTPFITTISVRPVEYHLRINSQDAKGGRFTCEDGGT